jgi:chromosome segregation ATPase
VRWKWVVYLATAMLAGAAGGALLAPVPAGAVAREIVELQEGVQQLIQQQKDIQTAVAQESAVQKTLIELSLNSVNKLEGAMGAVQKSVEEMHANSGTRLDTMSTQVQSVSDTLQEMQARMGKLNQQLTDAQNSIRSIDTKLECGSSVPSSASEGKNPKH